ncbi:MAG: branched-chain amino acid ABC transporter permease [Hyphomicrobiales bacterium]
MGWIDTIIQGLLLGGLYALFAAGLSLTFGIMRLINIGHGDLIVLAAYLGLVVSEPLGINPFWSLLFVVPVMAVFGYGLQRLILNRTLGQDILPPLLVTFGLSIILQNLLMELFSADSRGLNAGPIETASIALPGGLAVGVFPVIVFITAVGVIVVLQLVFSKTSLGRAFRAASDDRVTAELMGIDNRHIYGVAMAIALGIVGIAGVYLAIRTNFDPTVGPGRLLYAFEAVIIGGLGSLWGTLAGGMILGLAQSIGFRLDPGWGILTGHMAFLAVLVFRPNGLFPKTRDR